MARSGLLLTQAELATRWGVDRSKIKAWTVAGLLPTFTDPDTLRVHYPLPSIERWEASHEADVSAARQAS